MVSKKPTCKKCEKQFSSKLSLARHAAIHGKGNHLVTKPMKKAKSNQKVHKCDLCGKTFPSNFKLLRHGYSHMAIKPFPCDICERRFSRKDHLQVHYRIHTGEKTCFCMECGEGFNTTTSLHRHIIRLHSEDKKIVNCPECGMQFGFKVQLKRHYNYAHRESYTCNICGNISSSDAALQRHLKKHMLSQPFVCLMCAAHFNAPEDMRDHQCFVVEEDPCKMIVRVALHDSFVFEDDIDFADCCMAVRLEKKFDNRGRRPKQHIDDYEKYCYQKELISSLKQDIDEHIQIFKTYNHMSEIPSKFFLTESSDQDTTFSCKFCEKTFFTKTTLDAHVSTHLDNRNNSCSSGFGNASHSTNQQINYSMSNTKHLCKFCNNLFPSKDHLQMHMFSTHTTDDETCPYCFELCQSAEDLKEHLKTHQGPQEDKEHYICELCDSRFPLHSQLQLHFRTVHQTGNYNCKYCELTFDTLSSKLSHEQECNSDLNFESDEERLTIDENKGDDTENSVLNDSKVPNLWKCKPCKLTFETMKEKVHHIKLFHNQSFSFDCELCPCKFASEAGLRGHINNFHNQQFKHVNENYNDSYVDDTADINHCKECGETFVSSQGFFEHVQIHANPQSDAEELSCILCAEKFSATEELYKHLKNHGDGMVVEVGVHGTDSDGQK